MKAIFLWVAMMVMVSNAGASEMGRFLTLKKANYALVINHYQTLVKFLGQKKTVEFCDQVKMMVPSLNQILNDDHALIDELVKAKDSDSYEYAKSLDENSLSDLFASNIHQERCAAGNFEPYADFLQNVKYSEMNTEYLAQLHQYWMAAHRKKVRI